MSETYFEIHEKLAIKAEQMLTIDGVVVVWFQDTILGIFLTTQELSS